MARDAVLTPEHGSTAIPLETFQALNSLVASTKTLKQAGYVVKKLTDEELARKKRCTTCGVQINKKPRDRRDRGKQNGSQESREQRPQSAEAPEPPKVEESGITASGNVLTRRDAEATAPKFPCNFHPGKVRFKVWTCCGKHVGAPPCTGKEKHDEAHGQNGVLERRWQFHNTDQRPRPSHRLAIAIDCEMGTASDGDTELIRLSVIDYFSGEALIDSLVYPDVAMLHFNTRWSGVTRAAMEQARRQGQCILGRDAARRAVFEYVGPSTIVVGHSAQNDLSSLRWIHHRVVDSFIIESAMRQEAALKTEQEKEKEAVDKKEEGEKEEGEPRNEKADKKPKRDKHHPEGMSLKALAMKKLGRAIQVGKKGHDSLEDALAARDLVHAHITSLAAAAVPPS